MGGWAVPAPAGNTNLLLAQVLIVAVHPRACGEHSAATASGTTLTGSSPRLRGTPSRLAAAGIVPRFIPAPAGNTYPSMVAPSRPPVHPRACGEHHGRHRHRAVRAGSSPRLRGTPSPSRPIRRIRRFIPAPAGNTRHIGPGQERGAVHPRACGEHFWARLARHSRGGSSPRLRGTPQPSTCR